VRTNCPSAVFARRLIAPTHEHPTTLLLRALPSLADYRASRSSRTLVIVDHIRQHDANTSGQ
jgi:hypothetical protein